jgi:hypothetical protein
MNQNQSEGTAAKVKPRRSSPHSISRLPDVNTMSGTQHSIWRQASPELAGNNRRIRIIPAKHTLSIYIQYDINGFNLKSDMLYILLWSYPTCHIWKIQYSIKMKGRKTSYFIKTLYYIHI